MNDTEMTSSKIYFRDLLLNSDQTHFLVCKLWLLTLEITKYLFVFMTFVGSLFVLQDEILHLLLH